MGDYFPHALIKGRIVQFDTASSLYGVAATMRRPRRKASPFRRNRVPRRR